MLTKYAVNDKTRAGVFRRGVHHHKNIIKISVRDNDQNIISVEIQRFSKNWNNVCWVNDALCMRPLAGVTCQTSSPSLPHRSLPSFSHRSWRQAMAWAGAVTATGNHKGGGGVKGGAGYAVTRDYELSISHFQFLEINQKPEKWRNVCLRKGSNKLFISLSDENLYFIIAL